MLRIMSLITVNVYFIVKILIKGRYVMYQRPIEFLVPLPPLLSVDGWL